LTRRTLALAGAVSLLAGGCAHLGSRAGAPAAIRAGGITARPVATGLNFPAAFTFAPSGRIYYGEKNTGRIVILDPRNGRKRGFFRVPGVSSTGEQGLLGIAIPPGFPHTPYVYAYVTRNVNGQPRNQIVRITAANGSGGHMRVLFMSSTVAQANHNGGRILFGPDGNLYAVIGEATNPANSQDLSVPSGKILRMTPSGGVPKNPPLPGTRIDAFGIRNSFGFAFDPKTGRLWESENGPECNDELNRIVPGRNYGWGTHETCSGRAPRNTNQDGPSPMLPLRWYTPTIAPTGVAFCGKCGLGPGSNGKLFMGTYNTGDIRRIGLTRNRLGVTSQLVVYKHGSAILSMEAAPAGRLFFSDGSGIFRLVLG
jgi:glucose/arabinose dehydrogenase